MQISFCRMSGQVSGRILLVAVLVCCGAVMPRAASAVSDMTVAEIAVCREVVDRTPVEKGEIFPADVGALSCFTRIAGAGTDTEVTHEWFYKNSLVAQVPLSVRSANWRTFSRKTIMPGQTGQWRVEIRTVDGDLLTQVYFLIQ